MLKAEALCGGRGDRLLFAALNLETGSGTALHVTGANGSGKTTLLRMLAGLMPVISGRLFWDGIPLPDCAEVYGQQMTWLGHRNGLKPELTILENLAFAGHLRRRPPAHATLDAALQALALEELAALPVGSLSQGQQRRAALARVLITDARLWLLDEPTTALDRANADSFERCCERHLDGGGLLVFTSHQPLLRITERVRTLALEQFAVTAAAGENLCRPLFAI